MTSLTDSELQARLRALRVAPPAGEFHAQLGERLLAVASAPPAPVVSLRKWRTPRRMALLLAAAALPLGAYAATGGWVPGWGSGKPEATESLAEQAPPTESPRQAATRRSGTTAPTPPSPVPAPQPATQAAEKGAATDVAPRAAQRPRPPAPDAHPARVEQRAETADTGELTPAEERRSTERVRIQMNAGSKGADAPGKQGAARIRPGRTQSSGNAAERAGSGVDRRDSQSTAGAERERTWRRQRERTERSERQAQDRREKMRHRAR